MTTPAIISPSSVSPKKIDAERNRHQQAGVAKRCDEGDFRSAHGQDDELVAGHHQHGRTGEMGKHREIHRLPAAERLDHQCAGQRRAGGGQHRHHQRRDGGVDLLGAEIAPGGEEDAGDRQQRPDIEARCIRAHDQHHADEAGKDGEPAAPAGRLAEKQRRAERYRERQRLQDGGDVGELHVGQGGKIGDRGQHLEDDPRGNCWLQHDLQRPERAHRPGDGIDEDRREHAAHEHDLADIHFVADRLDQRVVAGEPRHRQRHEQGTFDILGEGHFAIPAAILPSLAEIRGKCHAISRRSRSYGAQPPVFAAFRSMMKSCPFGLRVIASSMAVIRAASSGDERSTSRRSAASSWPRHMNSVPVQVRRTRLQLSQKLWVIGVMKPSRPPVSPTVT